MRRRGDIQPLCPWSNFSVRSCKLFQISSLIQLFRETPLYQRQVYPCSGFSSIEWLQRIRNLNNNTKFYNLMIYQNGMLALAWAPSNPILSFHTVCFITIQKLKNSSKLGATWSERFQVLERLTVMLNFKLYAKITKTK